MLRLLQLEIFSSEWNNHRVELSACDPAARRLRKASPPRHPHLANLSEYAPTPVPPVRAAQRKKN
eukprot:747383-Hanusia_phi.AAC.3